MKQLSVTWWIQLRQKLQIKVGFTVVRQYRNENYIELRKLD